MKHFLDKYKYILLLFVLIIAVLTAAVMLSSSGDNGASSSDSRVQPPDSSATITEQTSAADIQTEQTSSPETAEQTSAPEITEQTAASDTTTTPAVQNDIHRYNSGCHFVIECGTILDNLDGFDKNKLGILPENGVIFDDTVGFDEGDSVFDILVRLCGENDIPLEYSVSPAFSVCYIEGIAGIYEFDCGSGSGWLFSVNGEVLSVSCDAYKPQNNDKITFTYTCNYGADYQ